MQPGKLWLKNKGEGVVQGVVKGQGRSWDVVDAGGADQIPRWQHHGGTQVSYFISDCPSSAGGWGQSQWRTGCSPVYHHTLIFGSMSCCCPFTSNTHQFLLKHPAPPSSRQIHRTLTKEFKYALVWGTSSKHYPQRCGLTHPLEDEDVVQVGVGEMGGRRWGRSRSS